MPRLAERAVDYVDVGRLQVNGPLLGRRVGGAPSRHHGHRPLGHSLQLLREADRADVRLEGDPAVQPDDGDVVAVGLRGEAVVRVQVHLEGHEVLLDQARRYKITIDLFQKVPLACLGSMAAAVQPNSLWKSQVTFFKTYSTSCLHRVYSASQNNKRLR